ncbi:CheR family methyltransferase [Tropicibacter sp. S64]|uniref:CheR family methyltransferase n=1 Tax=Tropicibacter sp. S64 TaxID=3415122 RepID=UPI003C7CFCEF
MYAAPQRPGDSHRVMLRRFVHDVTGIKLPATKDLMIESRLRRRVLAAGAADFRSYLHWLFEDGGLEQETVPIIDLLTTNKTDFFREPAHFDFLMNRIVPDALARAARGRQTRFRLWSAASSTGAEAWTAAMLMARIALTRPELDWAILGTDISHGVVERATLAVYPMEELRPVPQELRERYIMTGERNGRPVGRIVPELRARVRFGNLNLMETPYPVETGLDAVFLRNVLIYFDPPVQASVIRATAAHLRPGGYLIVGHSESMTVRHGGLHQVAPGVFQKQGES